MATVSYQVTSDNIAAVSARLGELSRKFDDLTPLMQQVAAITAEASERAFATESTPEGQPWEPLAASTARGIVGGHRRGEHPILQVFGFLAASLAPQVEPFRMVFGTNLAQSAIQQFGGQTGRGGSTFVPARAYVGLGPQDLSAMELAAVAILEAA
jgi:phage virion morphogenesis protein